MHLGNEGSDRVQAIFANADTSLRRPKNLTKIVGDIDKVLPDNVIFEEGMGSNCHRIGGNRHFDCVVR